MSGHALRSRQGEHHGTVHSAMAVHRGMMSAKKPHCHQGHLFSSIMFFCVSAKTLTMSWGVCTSGMTAPFEAAFAFCARPTCTRPFSLAQRAYHAPPDGGDMRKRAIHLWHQASPCALLQPNAFLLPSQCHSSCQCACQ